ncbi:hypothetical protein JCM33374_g1838 [Metschnikowia sp. JCM 33374]|nr:hypothetical protein JCM33374_g1838 [Metschnikowia sp. JCM 33374]
MGICFSCLGLNKDDGDYNERSSLLGSNNIYSDEDLHESLLKQQQRQNELSVIVNDLSDNLIDVSTFLSNGSGDQYNLKSTISGSQSTDIYSSANGIPCADEDAGSSPNSPLEAAESNDETDKSLPSLWPLDKKIQLMKEVSTSHASFNIEPPSESLYVVF